MPDLKGGGLNYTSNPTPSARFNLDGNVAEKTPSSNLVSQRGFPPSGHHPPLLMAFRFRRKVGVNDHAKILAGPSRIGPNFQHQPRGTLVIFGLWIAGHSPQVQRLVTNPCRCLNKVGGLALTSPFAFFSTEGR